MTENIAHELRTPLTTLKSYMAAIRDGVWEPTQERIRSCQEEIERLIHLVNDLEELNSVTSPNFVLNKAKVPLRRSIESVVELLLPAYLDKDVELTIGAMPHIEMELDDRRMMQVWTNLLTNALKFTPAQGKFRVEGTEEQDVIHLTVLNSGPVIPQNDLPHVFERFYRADKSRSRETGGGGLGLTIVESLVRAHGGKVWAESDESGTKIHVHLPRS